MMRSQDVLPYGIGIFIAIGGFALYFWLTDTKSDENSGQEDEHTLPGIYNTL